MAAKKSAKKKAPAKKEAAKKPAFKVSKDKALTKSQINAAIAEQTGLSKKEVGSVFEALDGLVEASLKRGKGAITIPCGVKVYVHKRPATKARMGRNPQTGEEILIAAKPARKVVKARPLKTLKEII